MGHQSVYTSDFLKHLILFPPGQWQDLATGCISWKIKVITKAGQNDKLQTELKIHRREEWRKSFRIFQVQSWII